MCERQELDARPSRAMWTELEMTRHAPVKLLTFICVMYSWVLFLGLDVKVLMVVVTLVRVLVIPMYSMYDLQGRKELD